MLSRFKQAQQSSKRFGNSALILSAFLKSNETCDNLSITKEDYQALVPIIDKLINERSLLDITTLSHILKKTDFVRKLQDLKIEQTRLYKLIYTISQTMHIRLFKPNEIVFREGDNAEYFYIVLFGSVNILKRKEKEEKMKGEDYLNHLINLKLQGEKDLFKKTIDDNQSIFPIEKQHFENLELIINMMKLRKSLLIENLHTSELEKLISQFSLIQSAFNEKDVSNFSKKSLSIKNIPNIQINKSGSVLLENQYFNKLKILEKKSEILHFISNTIDVSHYSYITNCERRKVKIHETYAFMELKEGSCFGDSAFLDKKSKTRNATISTNDLTVLALINEETFITHIQEERNYIKNIEISFLTEHYYFKTIKHQIFKENYFEHFAFKTLGKGEILFPEGDLNEYIYFIKEGECELSITVDFNGLIETIKRLSNIFSIKVEDYKIEKNLKDVLIKELEKVKFYRVYLSQPKQVLGLNEYFYQIPKIFKSTVYSKNLKYYLLEYDKQKKIMKKEKQIKSYVSSLAKSKMEFVIKRLIEIRDSEMKKLQDHLISENRNNLIMHNDELINQGNCKMLNGRGSQRLSKISEKLHIFNPLLTTKSLLNKQNQTQNQSNKSQENLTTPFKFRMTLDLTKLNDIKMFQCENIAKNKGNVIKGISGDQTTIKRKSIQKIKEYLEKSNKSEIEIARQDTITIIGNKNQETKKSMIFFNRTMQNAFSRKIFSNSLELQKSNENKSKIINLKSSRDNFKYYNNQSNLKERFTILEKPKNSIIKKNKLIKNKVVFIQNFSDEDQSRNDSDRNGIISLKQFPSFYKRSASSSIQSSPKKNSFKMSAKKIHSNSILKEGIEIDRNTNKLEYLRFTE